MDLPGCPAKHVTPDVLAWLEQYYWFDRTGQTPVQMGLCTIEDLDPRWFDVMRFIDGEVARQQRERLRPKGRP